MTVTAWCFREPGTAAAAVAVDQLRKHVDEDACLLWVDCDDPSEEEIAALAEQLGIHHLTAEDLVNANQRTKLERFADHFHVALHDLVFDGEVLQNREVDVVFSDGWLLSVRHSNGAEMAPAGKEALARFERQRGEHGSNDEGFLLWAILDVIVDRYFDVTTAIDERLDDIEDVVFDRTAGVIPREIFTLRRSIVAFRRAVGPLREVLAQLLAQGGRVHRRRGDRASPGRLRPHAARPRPDRVAARAPHRTARRPTCRPVESDEPSHEGDVVVGCDPDRRRRSSPASTA